MCGLVAIKMKMLCVCVCVCVYACAYMRMCVYETFNIFIDLIEKNIQLVQNSTCVYDGCLFLIH